MKNKNTFNRSMFIVLGVVLLVFAVTKYSSNDEGNGVFSILSIPDTEEIIEYKDKNITDMNQYYLVVNAPKSPQELREYLEVFCDELVLKAADKEVRYEMRFYRKSRFIDESWRPDNGYMSQDDIRLHNRDLIAVVSWSSKNVEKEYRVIERSQNKKDYGKIISRTVFVGDELKH